VLEYSPATRGFSEMQIGIASDRHESLHLGLRLEYFTISWNAIEAVVGLAAGIAAGSVALVGFALDSIVEASSGGILLWRFHAEVHGERAAEDLERRAIRLVAIAFLSLAAYVGGRAALDLFSGARPKESPVGIGLAVVSLIVMPILARRKKPWRESSIVTLSKPTQRRRRCARTSLQSCSSDSS